MGERGVNTALVSFFVLLGVGIAGFVFWPERNKQHPQEVAGLEVIEALEKQADERAQVNDVRAVQVKPLEVLQKKNLKAPPKLAPLPPPPRVDLTNRRYPPGLKKEQVYFKVLEGGYAVSFGDVIVGKLPPGQESVREGAFEPKRPQLWPSAEIPFQIASGVDELKVKDAIEYMERETPIRFVPLAEGDKNGIVFSPISENCASLLGMVGGVQPILLSADCGRGQILHEIMHALGFVHEHSRAERDQYVRIQWDNIKPEFLSQFNIIPDTLVHNYSGSVFSFDYESIMLYPDRAFSKDGKSKSLVSKTNDLIRPRQNELSRVDKERVYYLYGL